MFIYALETKTEHSSVYDMHFASRQVYSVLGLNYGSEVKGFEAEQNF